MSPNAARDAGRGKRLQPHHRVHFLAAVAPGPGQGELPVDAERAGAAAEVAPDDVQVRVLDQELAAAGAPVDVPGPHVLAGEGRLDARRRQVAQKGAVEGAVAVDRERIGRGPHRGHDRGHQPVALLPVRARHPEGNPAVRPPRGASGERDVGRRRGQVARFELQPVARGPIRDLPAELERPGRQIGRLPATAGHRRRGAGARLGAGEPHPRRRLEPDGALAAEVREAADGPVEAVPAGRPRDGLYPAHLEVPGERGEADAGVTDVERRLPRLARPEGGHREVERRLPAVGRRLGVPDLEQVVPPRQVTGQGRETQLVDARLLARERPAEVVAPSNLWNVPLKCEKPAAVKPSAAKKISRMRARSMSDSSV